MTAGISVLARSCRSVMSADLSPLVVERTTFALCGAFRILTASTPRRHFSLSIVQAGVQWGLYLTGIGSRKIIIICP